MNKIALGTVQFGIPYGVSNKAGKTSEVKEILRYAYKNNIHTLDTAAIYGDSEELIGKYTYGNNKWDIITKIPDIGSNHIGSKMVDIMLKSFEESLKKLKRKKVYGLLLHSCDNLLLPGGQKLLHAMQKLKDEGLVKKIGVSLYDYDQVKGILESCQIDLIQAPVNIFDQRVVEGGYLRIFKESNIEFHARSVFLQGLLLMQISDVPPWFGSIKRMLSDFHNEAKFFEMNTLQLSLAFVQSINEIDKIVVGVNTLKQLQQIVQSKSFRVNTKGFSKFSINDEKIINPSNWVT